jgi:hypothetical protein
MVTDDALHNKTTTHATPTRSSSSAASPSPTSPASSSPRGSASHESGFVQPSSYLRQRPMSRPMSSAQPERVIDREERMALVSCSSLTIFLLLLSCFYSCLSVVGRPSLSHISTVREGMYTYVGALCSSAVVMSWSSLKDETRCRRRQALCTRTEGLDKDILLTLILLVSLDVGYSEPYDNSSRSAPVMTSSPSASDSSSSTPRFLSRRALTFLYKTVSKLLPDAAASLLSNFCTYSNRHRFRPALGFIHLDVCRSPNDLRLYQCYPILFSISSRA